MTYSEVVVGGVRNAMFCSRWSDTAEHEPEFILSGVPEGTPAHLASRPLYHSKGDPAKAFATIETEIWKAADRLDQTCQGMARMYADLQEELRILTYNPITINTSTHRLKRRRGAQAAATTVEHEDEEEGIRTKVRVPVENEAATRREFDARPGNLVVMDNNTDNPDPYHEEDSLGD
eukprot:jgi/Tetstr1/436048/TSEL_024927.t1